MSTWVVTHQGDFVNLDHVIALEAMEMEPKDPDYEEGWLVWAVLSDNREVRLPGTFTTEAEAQRWLRDLLYASSAVIPEMAT